MADAADVVADLDAVNANVLAARIDAAQETIAAAVVTAIGTTGFGLMKAKVATTAVAVRIRKAAVVEVKDILLEPVLMVGKEDKKMHFCANQAFSTTQY